ncbi:MAG TPA: ABC transporter substrate-binding protein [Acetobacteraceae bacterium]|nr:ABC transporter substrate-binding protein [Acetobacteraceae bacterium]
MRVVIAVLVAMALGHASVAAEKLRIGLLHTLSPAPLYLAMARGYFAGEGLDARFSFFEAAQPIAAAAVAGDIDVGVTALTGGFFNLAGRGALKVIGGGLHEEKGFEGTALLVSKKAFDAGLTSPAQLAGHSLGITQYGSSFHYMAGRIAGREGIDLKQVTLRPLQTIGNMVAAVGTGQVDATMAIASMAKPLEASGDAKIIAWVGDLVPYQITAVFAPSRMTTDHADALRRFAAAYQHGVADYREAFLRRDAEGRPIHDGKTDAAIADIQRYVFTGDPAAREKILDGVGYYNEGGALDVRDVEAQLRWFVAQGLVKPGVEPSEVIDTRFLPTLPSPGPSPGPLPGPSPGR